MSAPRALAALALLAAIGALSSCEDSNPNFAEVQQIFASDCAGAVCHVNYADEPAGALDLSPSAMCASLVDVPALEKPDDVRVVPGSPDESYLLCKLLADCERRDPESARMPLGSADGLSEQEIAHVTMWIVAGAPGCLIGNRSQ